MRASRRLSSTWVTLAICLSACSMASHPNPGVNHVDSSLQALDPDAIEFEFLAWTRPYDSKRFFMSLPDDLFHLAFAPGRHLSAKMTVEGAECDPPAWPKGFRLPMDPSCAHVLRCRRRDDGPVYLRVETRWGFCAASMGEGGAVAYEPALEPSATGRRVRRCDGGDP